jgi:hypothetical protein
MDSGEPGRLNAARAELRRLLSELWRLVEQNRAMAAATKRVAEAYWNRSGARESPATKPDPRPPVS